MEVLCEGRLVGRDKAVKSERASGSRHVRRMDVVLERDRNPVERSANLALRALAIPRFRFLERMRIHGYVALSLHFCGYRADRTFRILLRIGDGADRRLPRADASTGTRRLQRGERGEPAGG